MDILLDSHALWWFLNGSDKMPKATKDIIHNDENMIYVSIATIWEIAIKTSIGKLDFDGGVDGFIEAIEDNGFSLLAVDPKHIKAVAGLPFIHRDPFDRMLIAQAVAEGMPIMTTDANVLKYDINSIW
jgi:PIN domain nuclease of toxin-antitoxin system